MWSVKSAGLLQHLLQAGLILPQVLNNLLKSVKLSLLRARRCQKRDNESGEEEEGEGACEQREWEEREGREGGERERGGNKM